MNTEFKSLMFPDKEEIFMEMMKECQLDIAQACAIPHCTMFEMQAIRSAYPIFNIAATLPDLDTPTDTHPNEEKTPEEKEEIDDIEKRARKPPADGPCKGCGENKPLNRLFLCYKCWVFKRLNDADPSWLPGDPHPSTCGCDGPGGCSTKDQGN